MTDTSKEAIEDLIYDLKLEEWDYASEVVRDLLSERDALRKAVDSYSYIGRDGKSVLAKDLEDERDALRTQLQAARNETLEEVALWYADKGWLLDEFNVPDAIRALKSTSAEGEG